MKPLQLTEPRPLGAVGRRVAEPQDGQALAAQLGSEVAKVLSPALERVQAAAASGRIDRDNLRALRDEIERARRVGMMAQQLVRLCSGEVHLASESIDLTELAHEALRQRQRETDHRGIVWHVQLAPAELVSDPTLVFAMLQALLDWCLEHAQGRVDCTLQTEGRPAQLSLSLAFDHQAALGDASGQLPAPGLHEPALNTMAWRLLEQCVRVLGFDLVRADHDGSTRTVLRMATARPRPLAAQAGLGPALPERGQAPLTGSHVVVLASRRELRRLVRLALRPLELVLDFVTSVEELRQLITETMPQAVVYEAGMAGHAFERLRAAMRKERPAPAFIRIAEQRRPLELHTSGDGSVASVSRDAILGTLPEALLFELSRARHEAKPAP